MLDTDLAGMLGFVDVRDIRYLIKRHETRLSAHGQVIRHTVRRNGPGRPANAYYLNQEQALYIVTESQTERASEIKSALVRRFMEYEGRPRLRQGFRGLESLALHSPYLDTARDTRAENKRRTPLPIQGRTRGALHVPRRAEDRPKGPYSSVAEGQVLPPIEEEEEKVT